MYQYFDLVNTTNDYTITYTYDDTGNLIYADDTRGSNLDTTFDWEGRSLLSYSNQTVNATYTYNENGIRTSKTVNGVTTTYFLDGTKVLYETDGTDKIYYTYDVDGTLISKECNGIEYYYVFNILGDVTHLLDSNGNIVVEYKYDAWGNLDNSYQYTGIGAANPYRYRGYRYDSETNLYYLQSRFYNPETGRFINADGVLQSSDTVLGHNMYAYVNNNPVMFTDPSGYAPEWANKMLIGAGIVAAIAVIAVITVATAGTGTLAAAIAIGALKGAAIGYVSCAAIGAGTGYLATGTSDGALNGMADGALTGAIAGAVIGGAYGGLSYSSSANTMIGKNFGKLGTVVENPKINVNWGNVSDYAMRRMTTRGVTKGLVNSTVKNGITLYQTSGRYLFITQKAAVATTTSGTLVTTYSSALYDSKMQEVIRILFGG